MMAKVQYAEGAERNSARPLRSVWLSSVTAFVITTPDQLIRAQQLAALVRAVIRALRVLPPRETGARPGWEATLTDLHDALAVLTEEIRRYAPAGGGVEFEDARRR